MSFTAEITEPSLSRDRQAVLAGVLVRELNVEPEEAELTALVMPALVGPFETAADRDAFLVALAEAGFAARPVVAEASPVYTPPTYTPPAYSPPAQPAYTSPDYTPPVQPAYTPPASPPEGYAPAAPLPSNNGTIIGVAILLAVIAAALAVVVLTQNRRAGQSVSEDFPPGAPPGSPPGDAPVMDSPEFDTDVPETASPVRTDDADFALGFSPRRGVNWDVFTASAVTRYASAPNSTPIPIRDNPSARHGTAVDEVSPGSGVTTSGCLPRRPEDGGRWCQLENETGWIYDRYLTSAPRRQAAPPSNSGGGVQTVRLSNGQTSLRLSEGGQTWNLPRPLSANVSISNIQRTTLAGRRIVQFTARDAQWTTTYFWEYRQGLLHFAGDDGRGTTNISEAAGSRAIIEAALGYVPDDDVVRGSGDASRPPTRQTPLPPSRISTAPVPNVIVMGSYAPGDDDALNARYAQAQQSGLTLRVVPASTYGMNGNYNVIVAGPYDRDTALRNLEIVRRYVPDAFRKALD